MKRFLKYAFSFLTVAVLVLVVTVAVRSRRTFEAPFPDLKASTDPAVIARGRYLAYGPAHCSECHGPPDVVARGSVPEGVPLSGGYEWKMPLGTLRAANITSDKETGIGGLSDATIARSLRHGVRRDGKALLPFMPFANLSDSDLVALISFLRTVPPVHHPVETETLNPLGKAVRAFLLEPTGPSRPNAATVTPEPSVAYGEYLANNVGNCVGCHTNRDMMTAEAIGPPFAGGLEMESDTEPGTVFKTPNLTPDPSTGRIAGWTEEVFIARFRAGPTLKGSHMPWKAFGRMTDDDLRALFRYLRSLPPTVQDTNPTVRREGQEAHASR